MDLPQSHDITRRENTHGTQTSQRPLRHARRDRACGRRYSRTIYSRRSAIRRCASSRSGCAAAGLIPLTGNWAGNSGAGRVCAIVGGDTTNNGGTPMSTEAWIILASLVALAVWAITIYNGLVAFRNRFKNAFAQIDVQLKRRYDLIPNLVETAKGYIKHERDPLGALIRAPTRAVTAARPASANPGNPAAMQQLGAAE